AAAGGSGTPATSAAAPSSAPPTSTPTSAASGGAGGLSPSGVGRPSGSPGTSAGTTVHRVGPADAGKIVTMHVGDRLQVTLAANRLMDRWTVGAYPGTALRLELG